jgi:hypothetical protein
LSSRSEKWFAECTQTKKAETLFSLVKQGPPRKLAKEVLEDSWRIWVFGNCVGGQKLLSGCCNRLLVLVLLV